MTVQNDIPQPNFLANDVRRAKRENVLGPDAACLLCGLRNVDALLPISRSVLESHHIVGRANDEELTGVLCRNCHAEMTEGYRNAGVALNKPPTFLHALVAILRAFGAFFVRVGEKFAEWASRILSFIARLDASLPGWRMFAEVRA
jgi:hypothetical protein